MFDCFVVQMPSFCGGKITKKYDQPDEFETSIGQTLLDLETNSDLKDLRDLTISGAKQIDVGDKKVRRCCCVFSSYGQYASNYC